MGFNRSSKYKFGNIRFACSNFLLENKGKIIIFAFLLILSILTGVLTAIKLSKTGGICLDDFSMILFIDGEAHTINVMLSRFLSCILISGLLLLFSLNYYVSALGFCLLVYRGYLLGLNCAILIIFCGFGGILNSILVIFPCHLIIMVLLGFMFCMMLSYFRRKKRYGVCKSDLGPIKILLIYLILIFVVCVIEAILLLLLQSKVVLVI